MQSGMTMVSMQHLNNLSRLLCWCLCREKERVSLKRGLNSTIYLSTECLNGRRFYDFYSFPLYTKSLEIGPKLPTVIVELRKDDILKFTSRFSELGIPRVCPGLAVLTIFTNPCYQQNISALKKFSLDNFPTYTFLYEISLVNTFFVDLFSSHKPIFSGRRIMLFIFLNFTNCVKFTKNVKLGKG